MGSIKLMGRKKSEALIGAVRSIAEAIQSLAASIDRLAGSGVVIPPEAGRELLRDAARIPEALAGAVADAVAGGQVPPAGGDNALSGNQDQDSGSGTGSGQISPSRPEKGEPVKARSGAGSKDPAGKAATRIPSAAGAAVAATGSATVGSGESQVELRGPDLLPGPFLTSFIRSGGMTIQNLQDMPHAGSIRERLASAIGEHLDEIHPFLSALKHSVNTRGSVSVGLGRMTAEARGHVVHLGRILMENALLENFYHNVTRGYVLAKMSENPAVVNFITGHWLEVYVFSVLEKMLESYRRQYSCEFETYGNLLLDLPDGNKRELDILCFINAQPLWIECKTGFFQNSLAKYKNFSSRYHIPVQNCLLVISGINDQQAQNIAEMHDIPVCTLRNLRTTLTRILDRMCMSMSISVSPAPEAVPAFSRLHAPEHFLSADALRALAEEHGVRVGNLQHNTGDLAVLDPAGLLIGRNYIFAKEILSMIRGSLNAPDHAGTINLQDRSSVETCSACQIMMFLHRTELIPEYSYRKVARTIHFTCQPSGRLISFVEGKWFSYCVGALVNKFMLRCGAADFAVARDAELFRNDIPIVMDYVLRLKDRFFFIKTAFRDYEKAALEISILSGWMAATGSRMLLICHDLTSEKIEKITSQCGVDAMNWGDFERQMPVIFGVGGSAPAPATIRESAAPDTAGTAPGKATASEPAATGSGAADPAEGQDAAGSPASSAGSPGAAAEEASLAVPPAGPARLRIHAFEFTVEDLGSLLSASGFTFRGLDSYDRDLSDLDGCANVICQNYSSISSILTSIYVATIRGQGSLKISAANLPDPVTCALCNLCLAFKRRNWLTYYSYSGNKTRIITLEPGRDPMLQRFISRGWLDHRIYSEAQKHFLSKIKLIRDQDFRIGRNVQISGPDRDYRIPLVLRCPVGDDGSTVMVKTQMGSSEQEAEELSSLGRALGLSRECLVLVTFSTDSVVARKLSSLYGITVMDLSEFRSFLGRLTAAAAVPAPEDEEQEDSEGAAPGNEEKAGGSAPGCDFAEITSRVDQLSQEDRWFLGELEPVQLGLNECAELFDDDSLSVVSMGIYTRGSLMLDRALCSPEDETVTDCSLLSLLDPCLAGNVGSSTVQVDFAGMTQGRQLMLYRLLEALSAAGYIAMGSEDPVRGCVNVRIREPEFLKDYLSRGWFAHLCSRMIEIHIINLTREHGAAAAEFRFGRSMILRCGSGDITVDFVLKPRIGVAFFCFAPDNFERAAADLSLIKSQKNLMRDYAVLVCNTEDAQLCGILSERYQIEVIPFSEYEDYLEECITLESPDPASDAEPEEEPSSPEDVGDEETSPLDDDEYPQEEDSFMDDDELMTKFGYCGDLADIISGRGR